MLSGEDEPEWKKHRVEYALLHVSQKKHKRHFNEKGQIFQRHCNKVSFIEINLNKIYESMWYNIKLNANKWNNEYIRFKSDRVTPKASSIDSSRVGGLANNWTRCQNQMMTPMTMGKKKVFSESHTLVNPPFWLMAISQTSAMGPSPRLFS